MDQALSTICVLSHLIFTTTQINTIIPDLQLKLIKQVTFPGVTQLIIGRVGI